MFKIIQGYPDLRIKTNVSSGRTTKPPPAEDFWCGSSLYDLLIFSAGADRDLYYISRI